MKNLKGKIGFLGGLLVSLVGAVILFGIFGADLYLGWKVLWILVVAFLTAKITCVVIGDDGEKAIVIGMVALAAVFIWRNFSIPHNPPLRNTNWWVSFSNPGQTPHSKFQGLSNLEINPELEAVLISAASKNGLPIDLVKQVITIESSWNPNAISRTGCVGLMQLSKRAAREEGLVVNGRRDDRYNPELNLYAGCSYLAKMIKRAEGNVALGLAYYNKGPNASQAKIRQALKGYADSIVTEISVPDRLLGL